MKITIVPLSGTLDMYNVGDIIYFTKTSSELSSQYIIASYNGEDIGFVASSTGQLLPGTETVSALYDKVGDEFKGTVSNKGVKVMGTTKTFLTVEISIDGEVLPLDSHESSIILKISGSTTANPGKSLVIADINKGDNVYVSLSFSGSKIIVSYNGIQSGVVSNKIETGTASIEERNIFKEYLINTSDIVEGKVISSTASAYMVSVVITAEAFKEAKSSEAKKSISSTKEPLVKMGFDINLLDSIENYLLKNNFEVKNILEIFSKYKIYPAEYQNLIPKQPKALFIDSNFLLMDAYASIAENQHIMCSGAKGSGKNVFIETWAWILQRPLFSLSMSNQTDKYDIQGSPTMEPIVVKKADGSEEIANSVLFKKEILLTAMEIGGIVNVDELNLADAGVTGLFHAVGDNRREIHVHGYGLVKAKDEFIMMGTMNYGYQGTNLLNQALADRFVDIEFVNTDSIAEVLAQGAPDIPMSTIIQCDKVYQQIVSILKEGDSSLDDDCLTVRGFEQAVKMSRRIPVKRALQRAVAHKVKDAEYRQNILDIIDTIIP